MKAERRAVGCLLLGIEENDWRNGFIKTLRRFCDLQEKTKKVVFRCVSLVFFWLDACVDKGESLMPT
jgi:hypothetical protein